MTKETSMSPTPLEIAAALRSAADFCRDPNSPKASGSLAYQTYRDPVTGKLSCDPTDPKAVSWCALGYAQRSLGIAGKRGAYELLEDFGIDWDPVTTSFDAGNYERASNAVARIAAEIEASLPVADHAPTRETSTA